MIYRKPEVAVLGGATRVIEQTGIKECPGIPDPPFCRINPAYDLDE